MNIARVALRSCSVGLSRSLPDAHRVRFFSISSSSGDATHGQQNSNSFESADEFERRIFGGAPGDNLGSDSFFRKLDRLDRVRGGFSSKLYGGTESSPFDDLDEGIDSLSDGMDEKLMKAARYFDFDSEEVEEDDYCFRPDMNYQEGMEYDIKDLDLTRPSVPKFVKKTEFQVTSEEVLSRADFRNVRFLANFITEAGIIIKRSQTGISAKAQRKVAREIKTARAFGLMPFTTMGTKSFVFGRTMEALGQDFEYETFNRSMASDPYEQDPLRG